MKILFALVRTKVSGGVRYIFEVANGLADKGHDVKIVSLYGDHTWFRNLKAEVIYKPLKLNKFSVLTYNLYKIYRYLTLRSARGSPYDTFLLISSALGVRPDSIVELAGLIRNFDADVTIATYYLTAFSVWFSQNKNPFYLVQDFPELVKEYDGRLGLNVFFLSLRLPFSFVTVSSYAKQIILENNPTAKVTLAHPGVNLNVFKPKRADGKSEGKEKVMVILRGTKFKGDEIALKVLKNVNKKIPIHAVIVGGKSLVRHYAKTIGLDFEHSVFSNVSDEVLAELYSSSNAFLYTSYAESFGLPPLEAMACGTPVVMTDNKGSSDYAVDGFNALISQPGDVKSLSDNLLKLLQCDKLRETLIENGLNTAKKFTWERTVENFGNALKEIN
ncbi:glycosyltransferase family 4 protein [Stygiolobus caldivivus]|uniref:Glycosyl transferase n=1 Tax=Stygiolobus caldivivus TaxID=2824673 RepID=A0A8D5ZGF0_9CREN|nr:glycosyltransferase family 4 protein [Stygiolobus caldivivus]BCU68744.1 glycosyl transferase [Stygiolobus caldivivus]